MLANFEEFVRVGVKGNDPTGNQIQGSRASAKFEWHVRHKLLDNGNGGWKRSTGDVNETAENAVHTGHVSW